MTKHIAIFAALSRPFGHDETKHRSQGGKQLSYVTARTVMNRLDEVLGPENWWNDYTPNGTSVICRLTIRLPDGLVVTKVDAGGEAGMADAGDNDKSGFSDALKRAAVLFGVGRYLYRDGVAAFTSPPPADQSAGASTVIIPQPPAPAPAAIVAGSEDAQGRGGKIAYGQAGARKAQRPRTGEDLHYYAKENAIDPQLSSWILENMPAEFPSKIIDFSPGHIDFLWPSIREHLKTVSALKIRRSA